MPQCRWSSGFTLDDPLVYCYNTEIRLNIFEAWSLCVGLILLYIKFNDKNVVLSNSISVTCNALQSTSPQFIYLVLTYMVKMERNLLQTKHEQLE